MRNSIGMTEKRRVAGMRYDMEFAFACGGGPLHGVGMNQAIEAAPRAPALRMDRGLLYRKLGRWSDAIQDYSDARALEEKQQWLSKQIESMIDRGQLTAEEKEVVLAQLASKPTTMQEIHIFLLLCKHNSPQSAESYHCNAASRTALFTAILLLPQNPTTNALSGVPAR